MRSWDNFSPKIGKLVPVRILGSFLIKLPAHPHLYLQHVMLHPAMYNKFESNDEIL